LTVPLPLPFAPPVIVSQDAFDPAVQSQPFPALTETLPVPALASVDRLEDPME
jgi:hypothetical protein